MGNPDLLSGLKKVETGSGWFEVYELPGKVYAIMEPHHFQEVISYLIVGNEEALLLDTGMGLSDIKKIVQKLWDGKLTVINSHVHFDHVGNNYMFDEVLVYNDLGAVDRLRRGYAGKELLPHLKRGLFDSGYMEKLDIGNYAIPPSRYKTVENGHMIDLGGRVIKVIHTPGHSPESIMLLDSDNKTLFTGDTYYPGHLYAHYEGDFYRNSNVEIYADTMAAVSLLADELVSLHPSHNDPVCDPQMLKKTAAALRKLADGKDAAGTRLYGDLSIASLPDSGEQVEGYVIPDDLYIYEIDGLKIIARKRG